MPAAAVIPAPIVYISVAAVKKLVACNETRTGCRPNGLDDLKYDGTALRGILVKKVKQ